MEMRRGSVESWLAFCIVEQKRGLIHIKVWCLCILSVVR